MNQESAIARERETRISFSDVGHPTGEGRLRVIRGGVGARRAFGRSSRATAVGSGR
jgi:hypothetical protein